MGLRVHVICQNYQEDRVLPRHARALAERLGWSLDAAPSPSADATYLLSYFEANRLKPWPDHPVGANFTHREEEPPGNAKAKCFDDVAKRVQLRTAWADMYVDLLRPRGPTFKVSPALDRAHFTLAPRGKNIKLVAGFSGYTYANHRKGEDLVRQILASAIGQKLDWQASGRGWPVKTKLYPWDKMPSFYQALDILVIPSRVEGIPMPPLEALCCGASVVIPWHVGMLDELPDIPGIHRYNKGDAASLIAALEQAAQQRAQVEPEALREATAAYSLEKWCDDHARAFRETFAPHTKTSPWRAPIVESHTKTSPIEIASDAPVAAPEPEITHGEKSKRGIYVVAFGEPARECAVDLIASIKKHMPDIPIAICGAAPIGGEDIFIKQPDSDVGARQNKIRMYDLAPKEWETVLYMDADMEVVAPVYAFFEFAEDGWDLVITKDPHLVDTMHSYARANSGADMQSIERALKTLNALQLAGGVMCFRRNARVKEFYDAWMAEWQVNGQRDQGPLVRALYAHPLKVWLLGSEWNTFLRYLPREKSAGLLHFPGKARRWSGMIPGRIDSQAAWQMVAKHEGKRK